MGAKVKVIVKAFEILEALGKKSPMSLREITDEVSYPKPTVFRLLSTLADLGYVEQDAQMQTYALSSKLVLFAKAASGGNRLVTIVRPHLKSLHKKFGETVNLVRLIDHRAVYVEILESRHPFRIVDNIGDTAHFHSTAAGKAIAAFLSDEQLDAIMKGYSFTPFTSKTIRNFQDLKKDLRRIRAEGYSTDDEEGHEGVTCLGVPIFNQQQFAFAAISISMPKVRAKRSVLAEIRRDLMRVGAQISLELGAIDLSRPENPLEKGL